MNKIKVKKLNRYKMHENSAQETAVFGYLQFTQGVMLNEESIVPVYSQNGQAKCSAVCVVASCTGLHCHFQLLADLRRSNRFP